ncbi:hypothetical protein C8D99_11245 [Aminivibrio pyruvatiphilus]|jgi:predicted DNA-binding protein (UPF0278 family)|uniref:Uncharacterized protein n=1 Tax=Aminivibrio pyruvatiphilus TaxID=1005740 RepID=A0A4R8M6D8_9BACT|nr:hypothetical protein [Aminivibrio pyruvatiphilus]TDY59537.1 hypothetical protein C8D99_11245 [Aminivibrio pyruvatiphilus]
MTHSLHRSGDIESQKKDFNWFMYQTKGVNDKNIRDKALEFIATAEAWHSENWGDVKTGPLTQYTSEEIRKNISDKSRIRGVFTSKEQVIGFLKDIKAKDLGMSVVITGVLSEVLPACREAEVTPHSINYSLGVWGNKSRLPDDDTLSITTMCGHHMIPPKFVEDVQKQVDKGKLTAEEGARKLSNFCYCGIFNQIRCAEILNIVSEKKKRDAAGA